MILNSSRIYFYIFFQNYKVVKLFLELRDLKYKTAVYFARNTNRYLRLENWKTEYITDMLNFYVDTCPIQDERR